MLKIGYLWIVVQTEKYNYFVENKQINGLKTLHVTLTSGLHKLMIESSVCVA